MFFFIKPKGLWRVYPLSFYICYVLIPKTFIKPPCNFFTFLTGFFITSTLFWQVNLLIYE